VKISCLAAVLWSSVFLISCGTAVVDIPLDVDLDGLMGDEEVAAGTNPDLADTDGDGTNDGDELLAGTDPLVAGYPQGWPIGNCSSSSGLEIGTTVGTKMDDFELVHSDGTVVRLYDFCELAVLLVSSADW
jgi:hypothetical protein